MRTKKKTRLTRVNSQKLVCLSCASTGTFQYFILHGGNGFQPLTHYFPRIWSAHKNGYSSVTKLNPHYNEDSAHLEVCAPVAFVGRHHLQEIYVHLFCFRNCGKEWYSMGKKLGDL